MALTEADKIELSLIALAALLTFMVQPILPYRMSLGMFILVFAVCLLVQSLIRDLVKLYIIKKNRHKPEKLNVVCMCVESIVGLSVVIVGLCILFIGLPYSVRFPDWYWPAFTGVTWLFGFVIKNYVLDFTNWRIKRVAGHHNFIIGR